MNKFKKGDTVKVESMSLVENYERLFGKIVTPEAVHESGWSRENLKEELFDGSGWDKTFTKSIGLDHLMNLVGSLVFDFKRAKRSYGENPIGNLLEDLEEIEYTIKQVISKLEEQEN